MTFHHLPRLLPAGLVLAGAMLGSAITGTAIASNMASNVQGPLQRAQNDLQQAYSYLRSERCCYSTNSDAESAITRALRDVRTEMRTGAK